MNDEKGFRLVIQVQVLAQQAPHRSWLFSSCGLLRIVEAVAECLDVAGHLPFHSQHFFKGRAGAHATVMINRQYTFAQIEGQLRMEP